MNLITKWICYISLFPFIVSIEANHLNSTELSTPGAEKIYAKICKVQLMGQSSTPYPSSTPSYDQNNYDPNYDPSYYDPYSDPNYDPYNDPNYDPYNDPNYDPSNDPNYDPSNDPNYDPSNDPNYDPNNGPYDLYADDTVYPNYDDSNVGIYPPTPDYETTNCTDIFPASGDCVSGVSANFIYWSFPTAACYLYEGVNCQGNGDSGTNDFFINTGQSPTYLSDPPKTYQSFVCYAKSNSGNIY